MKRRIDGNRLRKQPKRYRARSKTVVNLPEITVPKTAKKRKRRQKTKGIRSSMTAVKRVLFSPRWLSLALLALTVYALVIIAQDRRFYLTYIPVDGTIGVAPEEVVAISGLAGNHIFSAEPAKAAEQIAEIPGIISSTVTLRWPNQVYIRVAEEKPIMVWQEDGTEYGITQSGRLIPTGFSNSGLLTIVSEMNQKIEAPPPPEEPEEEGTEEETTADEIVEPAAEPEEIAEPEEVEVPEVESDEGPVSNVITLSQAAEAAEAAEAAGEPALPFIPSEVLEGAMQLREVRPTINQLYYRPYGGLSFDDDRGWRGFFGTGTDMNQKLVIYETIVEYLQTRSISPAYISVSNQEKPFYGTR